MTSRQFLCALFLAFVAFPIAAEAQETRVYRVAFVFSTSPMSELTGPDPVHPLAKAFVRGMRALGYVEGQNLILERRSAEGKFERFPEIFRDLVSNKVDVIVTFSSPLTRAARDVTRTVPIVMSVSGNPVEGLSSSRKALRITRIDTKSSTSWRCTPARSSGWSFFPLRW